VTGVWVEHHPELFGDALGLRPVADTGVVLADARDLLAA
jgi:hypothetical protein